MTRAASVLLVAAGFLAGCGHYVLGTGGTTAFKRIYIEPVANHSSLPQSVAVISTELRDAFVRDGRLTVVNSPEEAEVILSMALGKYGREVATVLPNDTGLARKFNLNLSASITLSTPGSDKVYFKDRPLQATRQLFTDNPQTGHFDNQLRAEYQAVPLLAQSLSAAAVSAVLDAW
ncbi:MAG: hypothetical protein KBA71_10770 [Opitutaceae bacterium]|nr:hypothetical protein [Opitutaceae bacterium]